MEQEFRTFDDMSQLIKQNYLSFLIELIKADKVIEKREFNDLYMLFTQSKLESEGRILLVKELFSEDIQFVIENRILDITKELTQNEKAIIQFSLVKDLVRLSRADDNVHEKEEEFISNVAMKLYPRKEDAFKIIQLAEESVECDKKLLKGELSEKDFEEQSQKIAASAAAIGVPVAALYFTGSLIGLGAAGIKGGLAAIGLTGVLGVGAVLSGVGVAVAVGFATYKLTNMFFKNRNKKKREEESSEHIEEIQKDNNSLKDSTINSLKTDTIKFLDDKNIKDYFDYAIENL
ncbi:DoxX family protein [bacterium]|nr:DoxX family protein [bacterium]